MTRKIPRAQMDPDTLAKVRKQDYQSAIKRAQGMGGMVPNDKVRKRLAFLIEEKGIPARRVGERTGHSEQMILGHYHGYRASGGEGHPYGQPLSMCTWQFQYDVLNAKFTPADQYLVPSCGVQRRVQALVHKGYSYTFLADQLGTEIRLFHRKLVTDARGKVQKTFHDQVRGLYARLVEVDPRDAGVTPHGYRYAQAIARKREFVPATCWDPDTIDDPDAFPEWTGECGTETGYFLHLKYDVLVKHWANGTDASHGKKRRHVLCAPCRRARSTSVTSFRKWSPEDRAAALAKIDNGATAGQVADEFGCSVRTIERFKKERRERNVA